MNAVVSVGSTVVSVVTAVVPVVSTVVSEVSAVVPVSTAVSVVSTVVSVVSTVVSATTCCFRLLQLKAPVVRRFSLFSTFGDLTTRLYPSFQLHLRCGGNLLGISV